MLTRLEPRRGGERDALRLAAAQACAACDRASDSPARPLRDSPAGLAPVRASCGRRAAAHRAAASSRKNCGGVANFHRGRFRRCSCRRSRRQRLGPQPRAAARRAGAIASPAARETRGCASCISAAPARRRIRPARRTSARARRRGSTRRCSSVSSRNGTSTGNAVIAGQREQFFAAHGRRPACSTGRSLLREATCSGPARPGPCRCRSTLPKPSHSGQAPSGLLKLYSRGSGAGYSRPQSSQVNCAAETRKPPPAGGRRSWPLGRHVAAFPRRGCESRSRLRPRATWLRLRLRGPLAPCHPIDKHDSIVPRPCAKAVSSESRSRLCAAHAGRQSIDDDVAQGRGSGR